MTSLELLLVLESATAAPLARARRLPTALRVDVALTGICPSRAIVRFHSRATALTEITDRWHIARLPDTGASCVEDNERNMTEAMRCQ